MTKVSAIGLLFFLGLMLSCGLHESSGKTGSACAMPGEVESCGCIGGVIGERRCRSDSTYSSCECPDVAVGQGDFNEGGTSAEFSDECHLPGNECLDGFICLESDRGTFECEFEDDAVGGTPAEGGTAGSSGDEVVVEPDADCRVTGCEGGMCIAVAPGQYECQDTAEPEPEPQPPNECGEFLECAGVCALNRPDVIIIMCAERCEDQDCLQNCVAPALECEERNCDASDEALMSLANLESCLQDNCIGEADWTACLEENCSAEVRECGPIPDGFFPDG